MPIEMRAITHRNRLQDCIMSWTTSLDCASSDCAPTKESTKCLGDVNSALIGPIVLFLILVFIVVILRCFFFGFFFFFFWTNAMVFIKPRVPNNCEKDKCQINKTNQPNNLHRLRLHLPCQCPDSEKAKKKEEN
jgi:hypothetical protein